MTDDQPSYSGVTLEEVLRLHDIAINGFGGATGVRDGGQLEACLATPLNAFFGILAYPTLPMAAAALLHGLAHSHPFVDGNKRTALLATGLFVNKNGFRLTTTEDELVGLVSGAAEGTLDRSAIGSFLTERIVPLTLADD